VKTVLDVLRSELQSKLVQQRNALSDGAAKDYADYKEQAGAIRGLTFALYLVEDLMRKSQEMDND
jgi:hypothetical protein